jgi:DNA transposition AAA+ family ATPase
VPNEALRTRFLNLLSRGAGAPPPGKFRAADIARELGVTDGTVSHYRNWTEGTDCPIDLDKYETALSRWFDRLDGTEEAAPLVDLDGLFQTAFTQGCAAFFDCCRRDGLNGLLYADAGSGKDCAKRLYAAAHPNTVLLDAAVYRSSPGHFQRELCKLLSIRRTATDGSTRVERMVRRLINRPTLVLLDNAQRLTPRGISLFMDLWDDAQNAKAKLAVVFIGNEEMGDAFDRNPQHSRRLHHVLDANTCWNVRYAGGKVAPAKAADTLREACERLFAAHWPAGAAECLGMAAKVAEVPEGGRLGHLVNVLRMAARLATAPGFGDAPEKCFRAAYGRLRLAPEKRTTL